MTRVCLLFFLFFQFGFFYLNAQEVLPLQNNLNRLLEKDFNKTNNSFHSSVKPFFKHPSMQSNPDSVVFGDAVKNKGSWIFRKLFHEHLICVDTSNFYFTLDPVVHLELTRETGNSQNYYTNTRGFQLRGKLGKQLAFSSSFYENQARFPDYITNYIKTTKIAPGQGLVKPFKTDGYDYAFASGLISYSPSDYFNFQFGHGKNFIGEGYRSLLLSDNSFNYPFLKITTTIWKLQYTNLFAVFLNPEAPHTYEGGFQKKHASFHYLSINVHPRLQFGLFEGIIWQDSDSLGRRGFDMNYFNPVIFYRPVEFSLSSPDNAVIGANLKLKLHDQFSIYGQFFVDDIDIGKSKDSSGYILNKYGFQAGFKWFDVFSVSNLYWQAEINQVQPYVYWHKVPNQNYSHYNQALAHPKGANFREIISILHYRCQRFSVQIQANYTLYGADTSNSHWGNNIFLSDFDAQRGFPSFGNELFQGLKTSLFWKTFTLGYVINPAYNFNLFFKASQRSAENNLKKNENTFVSFGISTSLQNLYYDF